MVEVRPVLSSHNQGRVPYQSRRQGHRTNESNPPGSQRLPSEGIHSMDGRNPKSIFLTWPVFANLWLMFDVVM